MVQVTLSIRFDNAIHLIDGSDVLSAIATDADRTKTGATK